MIIEYFGGYKIEMNIKKNLYIIYKMEFIEKVPLRPIYYLARISYDDFRQDCLNDAVFKGLSKPKEKDIRTWFNILQQFCRCNIKTKGITKRIYSYSAKTPAGLGGRLFCGGSIQGVWGKYRGLILRDTTTDVDMVNAHPVILRYICKKHNEPCAELEYYINNRDECLSKFKTREAGKKAYLCATNMDKTSKRTGMSDHYKAYDKEMKRLQKILIALPEYQQIVDTVPIEKRDDNYNGSAINKILCHFENIILQHLIDFLNKCQIEVAVPMFDGAEIYGDYYDDLDLLAEITKYITEKMPDLNMKWSYKEHNTELNIPDDFDETEPLPIERGCVANDIEATKTVYSLYPYWKFCDGVLYVFEDGIWTDNDAIHRRVITQFADKIWTMKKDPKTECWVFDKSYGTNTEMKTRILKEMPSLCVDDNWIKRTEKSSLGKLLFKNGWLDMKKAVFYDSSEYPYDPNIVFTYKIPYDWLTTEPEDKRVYRKSVERRMFYDPLGPEVGKWFQYNLARGLAGDVAKRIIFGLGYGNTGKSTLSKAILKSLGGYGDTFNANNLAYKQTGQDQAQQNRWIMMKKDKRIILSNEINSQITLNGNGIKVLSSGGDEIEGRGHCQAETTFSVQFLPVIFANDLPSIKPYDDAIDKRLRVVSYTKQYVEGEPQNEMELKGDPEIDAEIETVEFQQAFLQSLVWIYIKGQSGCYDKDPEGVISAKQDWIEDKATCIEKFCEDYDITDKEDDFVYSTDVEAWLKEKRLGVSMKKFGMDMKQYIVKNKLVNVCNKLKKIGGKARQVWFGVKLINEQPTIDDEEW